MNDSTAALEPSPKSWRPISGSVERSRPIIAPTNALMATSSENCAAFSRSPRRTRAERLNCPLRLRALLGVDEQRSPDDVGGDPGEHDSLRERAQRRCVAPLVAFQRLA